VVIEQAKGVVAERARISLDSAFARLRSYARANNLRLSEVAAHVIDGRLDPTVLLVDAGGTDG
jgi:AmiR/NasT family two-component response regulator